MKINRELQEAVKAIGFSSFDEYFISNTWNQFRMDYWRAKMPQSCIVCDFHKIMLYHVKTQRLGKELLTDVIPTCRYCYNKLYQLMRDSNSRRIDHVIMSYMKWSNKKRVEKFALWLPAWEKEKHKQKPSTLSKPNSTSRSNMDFYKIGKDIKNFRNYVREGYTVEDLASIYKVKVSYIKGYINKYPEQVI